jgi:conjugative relaxase-like TrwC/TraI family protein
MVSLSKGAMNVAGAKMYFQNHYSVRDYYAEDESLANGYLLGKGAQALGLNGNEITAEQFDLLLQGRDPTSGAVLRAKATHGDIERAGWDITLSPPKTISMQALVAGDRRLIEADRQAAICAIQEVEPCALSRQHGGSQWMQTGNVVAVMFEHHEARESINGEHGPMPQLHHHTFLMNLTQRPDGEWRGLEPNQIYKTRAFIDAVYMTGLAKRVQQLGYQIVRGSDGTFELAGFTRAQIEAFSERGQDIKRIETERGITSPRAARDIRLETRKPKRAHDAAALKAEHEALAAEHGIDLSYRPTTPVRTFAITPETQADRSLDFAIRHTTNRNAVPDHRDIALAALRHGVGATDVDHVHACMATRQGNGQLIAAGKSHTHPLDRYTTPEMVRLERENLTLVRDQMSRGRPIAGIPIRSADGQVSSTGTREVREWAGTKKLLPDQTEAAMLTLTTPK